jgi:ribonucleases P/MRP protein subunit RPP40
MCIYTWPVPRPRNHRIRNYTSDTTMIVVSSFLLRRIRHVVLENCLSSIADVISGVPQGSVLGPILFVIFISNDVVSTCLGNTTVKLFADDLKLYSIFNSANGVSDLQQSLDLLVSWSNVWQLKINIS